MMLAQALQYPLRGKRSLHRLLILALLQLLPIVGQLILFGYGFDIVRAVYAEQTELPSLLWLPALRNGLHFFLAGLGYLLPILITIGIVVGTTTIVGLVLFILPGLFAFVICSLAVWYLFAQYSINAEIQMSDPVSTKSVNLTL